MEFLNPKEIVGEFGLKPGMIAADFGSGSGFFSLEIARAVGGAGKVFAVDVQKETLEAIRSRAKIEHISNIQTIWADLEIPGSTKLKDGSIDFVMIANILFQADDKQAIIKEAWRILKYKGFLGVVEQSGHFSKEEIEKLFLGAGFSFGKAVVNSGDKHHGFLFVKSGT